MFDAAVEAVKAQGPLQASLGLKAIAAAGRDPNGVEIHRLRNILQQSNEMKVHSGEDILKAARGLLTAPLGFEVQSLCLFGDTFENYVMERYNDSIYLAHQQLPQGDQPEDLDRDDPNPHLVDSGTENEWGKPHGLTGSDSSESRAVDGSGNPTFIPAFIIRKGTRMWV